MPAFAAAHPSLHVTEIKITTILSDEAKNKQLDTVKCHFTVSLPQADGEGAASEGPATVTTRIEVDIMPTIGEEIYDDTNRVPQRNERGTIDADALRRDLTIGALFLQVEEQPSSTCVGVETSSVSDSLNYRLIDLYRGVADLKLGVLRSPVPRRGSAELEQQVATSI